MVGITAKVLNQPCKNKTLLQVAVIQTCSFPNGNLGDWLSSLFSSSFQISLITSSCALEFLSITASGQLNLSFIIAFTMGYSQCPGFLHPVCHTQFRPTTVRWAAQKWHLPASAPSSPAPPCMAVLGLDQGKRGLVGAERKRSKYPEM